MTTFFDLKLKVQSEHIDLLGHVNNVKWMQDVATAHIDHIGLGLEKYLELKHAMVAVEHHMQYKKASVLGDDVVLRTWFSDINAMYSYRQYVFYRPADRAVLFVASTKWACVEIATGKPKRLSPTFTHAYQSIEDGVNPLDFSNLEMIGDE